MKTSKGRRIFFGLWPDRELRETMAQQQQLLELQSKVSRYVPAHNLHLTLHFIGNVPEDRVICMQEQATAVSAKPFEITLDNLGFFKKPRVSWFGCSMIPEELRLLHRRLGEKLANCGFQAEQRRYNPHVTIARKQLRGPTESTVPPMTWAVSEFVLIESVAVDGGVRYEVLSRYPLHD